MLVKQKLLFSKEECDSIINNFPISNKQWNMADRKYQSHGIDYSKETEWIFNKLQNFIESNTNINLRSIKKQIYFHRFTKDDWFKKHTDVRDDRVYAVGVLLNNEFTGGDFMLYNPTELKLDKITGNTYIFDVRIIHEIKPVENGERYSLLWFIEAKHISIKTDKLI